MMLYHYYVVYGFPNGHGAIDISTTTSATSDPKRIRDIQEYTVGRQMVRGFTPALGVVWN